ncbi:thiamine pyrophosphate-dependent enzyme [Oligoflexus tunisiensis]|uniref:thiamine pyrophosphate-dependent enzyme n=1 Tax=Oligoflexus tunisiensis TaxID=708132 RepID=UPI000AB1B7A1|nr:thiamine pyrophosphate-dependent enzyme [Oligoflexus tunisiensis]
MKKTAADVLIERLISWDVDVIFGLPGDGINGIMEALRTRQDQIRFIQVRHEENAAFMACAYSKFTGRLGVCLATSGPGGIHLLNGLYDAKLDGQAVLAITGLQFHDLINTHTQQDVELDKLFQDVAIYNNRIMGTTHVEGTVDLACRTALSYKGVAHITFPVDIQSMTMDKDQRSERNVPHHGSTVQGLRERLPSEQDLRAAADVLNSGKKVALLVGRGALGCVDELEMVAKKLGAPIIKALLGKAAVPDDSPYTTGGIGLLGTKASQEALENCDTLFIIGTSFPYIEYYPKPGQAKAVQIDMDPMRIGNRYPVDVALVGDSRKTLQNILPRLHEREDKSFLESAQKEMASWWELMEERGTRPDTPMKPQVVAWQLDKYLTDDAIICSDSGTITTWWARQIRARRNQMFSCSGNLATMACGLSYAIAAQIAYPGRQCVAFIGDGGFSMSPSELATCVKYKLPVKIIVIKNNSLGQIKWEQMVFLGNPEFGCELQPIDFAAMARAFGVTAYTIEDPADCGRVLQEALMIQGPVLVEAVVDPLEPPMPAKISVTQAKHFAESLAKGQPYAGKIALTVAHDRIREMI